MRSPPLCITRTIKTKPGLCSQINPKLLDNLNSGIKKGKVRNKVRDIP
jgi:hypothetical protein